MLSFSYLNYMKGSRGARERLKRILGDMKIYFSGGLSVSMHPESLIPERRPHVMMSFNYLNSKKEKRPRRRLQGFIDEDFCRIGSLFIDSGAFTLFAEKAKKGKNYDFYSLKPGSEFRAYCDQYARFIRMLNGKEQRGLVANVDVIYHPEKTFEAQEYFEKEHGLRPIPVVHFKSDYKWIEKYLSRGYDLIGLGGFAWGGEGCNRWLDGAFSHYPKLKAHGFALTSWSAIQRWPWHSVDSTTWLLTSAFGGILVPALQNKKWRYDAAPFVFTVTQDRLKSLSPLERDIIGKWLNEMKLSLDLVSKKQSEEESDRSYIRRCLCNLTYFKNLEEAERPYPARVNLGGFGL